MDGVLRQGVFALLGIPLMFLISRLPVDFLKRMAWPALFGAVALQMLAIKFNQATDSQFFEFIGETGRHGDYWGAAIADRLRLSIIHICR